MQPSLALLIIADAVGFIQRSSAVPDASPFLITSRVLVASPFLNPA
jgi:hypothetical protein